MAESLKLKLSRVIPSVQFCRSKHSLTSAQTPSSALYRLSPFNAKAFDIAYPYLPAPPPPTPEHPFVERNVSSKVVSLGCGGCLSGSCTPELNVYSKLHEPKHPTKITCDTSSDSGVPPISVNKKLTKKQSSKKEKKIKPSVSSRYSGFFGSQEKEECEETDTLISTSRSFSDDTSSFEWDDSMESTEEKTKRTKKKVNKGSLSPEEASILKRMEGKVRESVAVVKKSEDPYGDFKRSMLEMILEKEMFEAKELEELLQCFLSLNSRQYHRIIVDAFSDVWEFLFSCGSVQGQRASMLL